MTIQRNDPLILDAPPDACPFCQAKSVQGSGFRIDYRCGAYLLRPFKAHGPERLETWHYTGGCANIAHVAVRLQQQVADLQQAVDTLQEKVHDLRGPATAI